MDFEKFLANVITDLRIELTEEFDRNFERKAFFTEAWPTNKMANSRGSMMQRTGVLRGSIESDIGKGKLEYSSSEPYASIHNEGGEIVVTQKMKSYFWAMYYKAMGAVTTTKVKGERSKSKKNQNLEAEAAMYRNLALMKVGHVMKIEQRQFIGWHPEVDQLVKSVVDDNLEEINKKVLEALKPR